VVKTKGSSIRSKLDRRSLFREVNERIRELNGAFGNVTGRHLLVCECGRLECTERMEVPAELYEEVRAEGHGFLVKPGHEESGQAQVIAEGSTYCVVAAQPEIRRSQLRVAPAAFRPENS
jgi:hypothetical protein